mmetsp:Transcript_33650/g.51921  ORF Transcript_33650/g.51921 Transcript_33650/m.51921 type:complete len:140 (-) Transcript_33650:647-1066(-)
MHCRHGNLESAIQILTYACTSKRSRLGLNQKCWSMLIDLQMNLLISLKKDRHAFEGDEAAELESEIEACEKKIRFAFNRMIDFKIITPALVLNYASFLQVHCSMYEESFRILERAIDAFPWPHKYEIWIFYLRKAVYRF